MVECPTPPFLPSRFALRGPLSLVELVVVITLLGARLCSFAIRASRASKMMRVRRGCGVEPPICAAAAARRNAQYLESGGSFRP